jgi:hypothetical protein
MAVEANHTYSNHDLANQFENLKYFIGKSRFLKSNLYQIFVSDFNIKSDQQHFKWLVGL